MYNSVSELQLLDEAHYQIGNLHWIFDNYKLDEL